MGVDSERRGSQDFGAFDLDELEDLDIDDADLSEGMGTTARLRNTGDLPAIEAAAGGMSTAAFEAGATQVIGVMAAAETVEQVSDEQGAQNLGQDEGALDSTVVMSAAALEQALAAAQDDGFETTDLRPRRRRKGPHASIKLANASEEAQAAEDALLAAVEAALDEAAVPTGFPEAGQTMVLPSGVAAALKSSDQASGSADQPEPASKSPVGAVAQPAPAPAPQPSAAPVQEPARAASGLPVGAEAIVGTSALLDEVTPPVASALFLSSFFDELYRMGVRDVVVCPGSRSTPLAMVAFEMSRRPEYDLRLFVDVDERGAAFFALGLAKASGRPAAVVCTSGTAGANFYPAVLEAESSRVPLLVLTGDRPPRLQGLGAPQTCNQEKLFADHVRSFVQMPLPSADAPSMAFARQAAREACANALGPAGSRTGGPVQLNFPFEEPLKPDLGAPDLFTIGRSYWCGAPEDAGLSSVGPLVRAGGRLSDEAVATVEALFAEHCTVILAGEGSCEDEADAVALMRLAEQRSIPVLADPLSNLRRCESELLIEHYDSVLGQPVHPDFDLVVRFGRYPVSKRACTAVQERRPFQIVVDQLETRDFNAGTDLFVRMAPRDFVRDLNDAAARTGGQVLMEHGQRDYAEEWKRRNDEARARAAKAAEVSSGFEGAYVRALLGMLPEGSLLFTANSMSVRAVDAFCDRGVNFDILCNRGLNGIDGTLSTALGAAQAYQQTTLLTGDLALLHDLSAFALHAETIKVHRERGDLAPSLVIVLLNNHGGGIFDMLPQKSEDAYFERLFLTPEHADFGLAAAAFDVPHVRVTNVEDLKTAYRAFVGRPGLSLVEIEVPLVGLKERYAPYW